MSKCGKYSEVKKSSVCQKKCSDQTSGETTLTFLLGGTESVVRTLTATWVHDCKLKNLCIPTFTFIALESGFNFIRTSPNTPLPPNIRPLMNFSFPARVGETTIGWININTDGAVVFERENNFPVGETIIVPGICLTYQ